MKHKVTQFAFGKCSLTSREMKTQWIVDLMPGASIKKITHLHQFLEDLVRICGSTFHYLKFNTLNTG